MSVTADWEISSAAQLAQLQGLADRADAGAGNSIVRLYITSRPASIADSNADSPQAEIMLAKPCGSISGSSFVLHARDAEGSRVAFSGIPRWADWVAADGTVLLRANVSDTANAGGWKVEGAETPEGETSPRLYLGGLVILGTAVLT